MRAILLALGLAAGLLAAGARAAGPQQPFVIAPVVEGLFQCDSRGGDVAPDSFCAEAGGRASTALARLLDGLEPGGARGDVQVGYVLTVPLLALYRQQQERWVVDEARLARIAQLLVEVDRPVVVYLAANHFDSQGPLPAQLAQDPRNLLALPDGRPPRIDYFGYPVFPWTLRTDPALPVNRYRFEAMALLARRLAALPAAVQRRLVGVALGGELHHLFADFSGGMGTYRGARVTDYSPASQRDFREWLLRKHGSIDRLNAWAGTHYRSFDEVTAPGRDVFSEPGVAHADHYDGYAGGILPVHGWHWDPQRTVRALELRVDGRVHGPLQRGFNRLDVYRAKPEVTDPNVGFRADVDFSDWAPGAYRLQVVAKTDRGDVVMAERRIHVEGLRQPARLAGRWERLRGRLGHWLGRDMLAGSAGELALDVPEGLRVLYNPMAREWNAFRAWQVRAFMDRLDAIARDAGLPPEKIFAHQILPRVNSSWNADLFAADLSLDPSAPWQQGFNTYGGAAGGAWIEDHVRSGHIAGYGVPEFHPQQWKRPQAHAEALELHRRLGARFVSPYYMSVTASRAGVAAQAVKALEIRPNNPQDGSGLLYEAIRAAAAR